MEDTIHARRSIRKYLDTPVSEDAVSSCLEAARMAPSAKNRQPWHFYVARGAEKQRLLAAMQQGIARSETSPFLPRKAKAGLSSAVRALHSMEEAPVLILVVNTNATGARFNPYGPAMPGQRVHEIHDVLSIGAAIENLLLRATELGLGSLWIANTVYAHRELTAALGVKCQLVGAVSLGYAAESPEMRPKHTLEEIVTYLD